VQICSAEHGRRATAPRFFEDLRPLQPIRKCPRCGTSKKQASGQCADCSVCPVHDPALGSRSLRKNRFEIRIMMLPNLSEAVTVFFRPAHLLAVPVPRWPHFPVKNRSSVGAACAGLGNAKSLRRDPSSAEISPSRPRVGSLNDYEILAISRLMTVMYARSRRGE
jgi:hypothetical protein